VEVEMRDRSGTSAGGSDQSLPTLGVGVLGYSFMGKAHTNGYKTMPYMMWPPPAVPRLVAICGRNAAAVAQAAVRYGYARSYTDWQEMVADPEIDIFDNGAPNDLHAAPSIAAARAGKHVLCEKPLARDAHEARQMLDAVRQAGVKHMVSFNYRFVPALRLAYDLIQAGRLGEIYHFRGCYLKGSLVDPEAPMRWRYQKEIAGLGTLGDLGAHTIDLARWLVGEVGAVSGLVKTFIPDRPAGDGSGRREAVTVDDAAISLLEFENGAIGTLEASRFAQGHINFHTIEINGSKGSISFNLERLNELLFFSTEDPPDVQGWHDVLVTEANHPYYSFWWPPGHIIGWEHTFVHEIYHFFQAVTGLGEVAPHGATFEDGYRNAVIADGIVESSQSGRKAYLTYGE
jgi:predicted dehydrogenase